MLHIKEKTGDILAKNGAKTMGYIIGYIRPKVWDILGKHYGIYYGIYWLKIVGYICQNYGIYWSIGYIKQKLRDVFGKILGYRKLKLWDILWDIF